MSMSVVQEWVADLTFMQQSVLLTSVRGPDGLPKYHPVKFVLRWYCAEILGYKHPDAEIRDWWRGVYERLVHDMHLWPETEQELDRRLGDTRDGWLARADKATVR